MAKTICFVAGEDDRNMPVGRFLRKMGLSAGAVKRIKFAGSGIMVDGKAVWADYRLTPGQTVTGCLPEEDSETIEPQDIPLQIAFEDRELVVLDKPAGMAVHPSFGLCRDTLANAWMGELKRRGEQGLFRPVYRIDRNTSGLVVCAKDSIAADRLSHGCQKLYYAVAEGHFSEKAGRISVPIARDPNSIIKRCVSSEGKAAETDYRIVAEGTCYSLVECRLATGRTHQIRVHMAYVGHPLAGDDLYGGHGPLLRQGLHCGLVSFVDGGGKNQVIKSPMPSDMADLLVRDGIISTLM